MGAAASLDAQLQPVMARQALDTLIAARSKAARKASERVIDRLPGWSYRQSSGGRLRQGVENREKIMQSVSWVGPIRPDGQPSGSELGGFQLGGEAAGRPVRDGFGGFGGFGGLP